MPRSAGRIVPGSFKGTRTSVAGAEWTGPAGEALDEVWPVRGGPGAVTEVLRSVPRAGSLCSERDGSVGGFEQRADIAWSTF